MQKRPAGNVFRMTPAPPDQLRDMLNAIGADRLPGHLGLEIVSLAEGQASIRCELATKHLAPNGYLHAGTVVSLADTAAGYGCMASLPVRASGFTTIELKTNFVGTLLEGSLVGEASLVHGGNTTQVWDVVVSDEETGRPLAHFRCTQMILYPK